MKKLELSLACGDYEITRPLQDGRVNCDGVDLTVLTRDKERIFRLDRRNECDISEFNVIQYLKAREDGAPITALPVFPHRRFRHGSIFAHQDSEATDPRGLVGKSVGIGGYEPAAAIWIKGILHDQYDVSRESVDWVDVFGLLGRLPDGWTQPADAADPKSRYLIDEELLAGRLDGMASAYIPKAFLSGDSRIRRLFADYQREEIDYYKRFEIFPIMHVLTIKTELIDQHPWLPASICAGFAESQRVTFERLHDPRVLPLAFSYRAFEEQEELLGTNPWEVGLTPGNARALNAVIRYAHEQGITKYRPPVDELFFSVDVVNDGSASFI